MSTGLIPTSNGKFLKCSDIPRTVYCAEVIKLGAAALLLSQRFLPFSCDGIYQTRCNILA
jgi:hypothetical protein